MLSLVERSNSINLFLPPINETTEKRPSVENANKIRLFIICSLCRRHGNEPGRRRQWTAIIPVKQYPALLKRHSIIYFIRTKPTAKTKVLNTAVTMKYTKKNS